jgi:hypothetical protein
LVVGRLSLVVRGTEMPSAFFETELLATESDSLLSPLTAD